MQTIHPSVDNMDVTPTTALHWTELQCSAVQLNSGQRLLLYATSANSSSVLGWWKKTVFVLFPFIFERRKKKSSQNCHRKLVALLHATMYIVYVQNSKIMSIQFLQSHSTGFFLLTNNVTYLVCAIFVYNALKIVASLQCCCVCMFVLTDLTVFWLPITCAKLDGLLF